MINLIKPLTITALLSATLSLSAFSHPRWILPSHFTFSKEQGEWAAFDISGADTAFIFDKPASSSVLTARVIEPSGECKQPNAILKGKRRLSFDYFFEAPGTYKITANTEKKYRTKFTDASGEEKTLKVHKLERDVLLPEGATNITSHLYFTRVETYLSKGAPDKKALALENQLLEIMPISHPSDLIEGEPMTFEFYSDGKTQEGVEVQLVPEGRQYSDAKVIKATSDKSGQITITAAQAGRYLLKAKFSQSSSINPLVDVVNLKVHLTLEVQAP